MKIKKKDPPPNTQNNQTNKQHQKGQTLKNFGPYNIIMTPMQPYFHVASRVLNTACLEGNECSFRCTRHTWTLIACAKCIHFEIKKFKGHPIGVNVLFIVNSVSSALSTSSHSLLAVIISHLFKQLDPNKTF